jgi:hypothetical protein
MPRLDERRRGEPFDEAPSPLVRCTARRLACIGSVRFIARCLSRADSGLGRLPHVAAGALFSVAALARVDLRNGNGMGIVIAAISVELCRILISLPVCPHKCALLAHIGRYVVFLQILRTNPTQRIGDLSPSEATAGGQQRKNNRNVQFH